MRGNTRFTATLIFIFFGGVWIGRQWSGCQNDLTTPSLKDTKQDRSKQDRKNEKQEIKSQAALLSNITAVFYCQDEQSCDSLHGFVRLYPEVKVLLGVAEVPKDKKTLRPAHPDYVKQFADQGEALNELISKVETHYFLHVDANHEVSARDSDESVDWLWKTMEKVKSLDLIGGSLVVAHAHKGMQNTLEIPCYRLHLFNYTYWETYEYEESIDDVMLCERISTTFLARTSSFTRNKLKFDTDLGDLMFEDFFLQTKTKSLIVATKPDVYFFVRGAHNTHRSALQHVSAKLVPDLIPFGLKHHVMTIKDIDGNLLYVCERYSTMGMQKYGDPSLGTTLFGNEELLCDYDKTRPYWKMRHWAYAGMFSVPTMRMALRRSIAAWGEFFDSKNIAWSLLGGGLLGAVKTRGFLPWEAGDIDVHLNTTSKQCADMLKNEFVRLNPDWKIDAYKGEVIIKPKRGFGGWGTIFFGNPVGYPKVRHVRMELDGYWVPIQYNWGRYLIKSYKVNWLQHKMYRSGRLRCLEKSNSCLPDYRKLYSGRGGVWREFFADKWGKSAF